MYTFFCNYANLFFLKMEKPPEGKVVVGCDAIYLYLNLFVFLCVRGGVGHFGFA